MHVHSSNLFLKRLVPIRISLLSSLLIVLLVNFDVTYSFSSKSFTSSKLSTTSSTIAYTIATITKATKYRRPTKLQVQQQQGDQRPSFSLLPNLPINPFQRSNDNIQQDPSASSSASSSAFTSSYIYDGTSDDGFILHAKYIIQQTDLGIIDTSILDDTNFRFVSSQLDIPLYKTDYITAGRFFNLRNTFPDLNYRPYDFRIVFDTDESSSSTVTVRCTCRVIGTMRGELRLRNNIILAPTGLTMRCPPEAMTISFHKNTGKVIKLCTGFVLDRFIGNTKGTTGVQAACIIAGEDISIWDIYPPMTIINNIFARPTKPIQDETTTLSPFPESVMIQLAKGILSSQMAYNDPTLLSDNFVYCTPIIGPIRKQEYIQKYAQQEFPVSLVQPNFLNFRVDPYDPVRVWVDVVLVSSSNSNRGNQFISPPQAMSFTFDENGYCTRVTSQAIIDPSVGTSAGGLGGVEGYQSHVGQASLGIYTRPISRSVERLRIRLTSPITGINVDEYPLPKARKNLFESLSPSNKVQSAASATMKKPQPPPIKKGEDDNEVVRRLEQLKEFTSSIRIIPPTKADQDTNSVASQQKQQQRLAKAKQATEQSKIAIEKAKREAAMLQQKIMLAEKENQKKREQEQAILKAKQQKEAIERKKKEELEKKEKMAELARQKQVAVSQQQKKEQIELQKKAKAEVERRKQVEAEKARQVQREQQRKKEEIERQRAAAAEADIRRRELEAQRAAEAAEREAQKVQMMKLKLEEQQQRQRETTAMKAKSAAAALSSSSPSIPIQRSTPSKSVYSAVLNSSSDTTTIPSFDGLTRATISLFGLGKKELEELPAPKVQTISSSSTTTKSRRTAPFGVPTITRWRQNSDKTITGLVKGSRNFDDGSRITTSPITNGIIASGEVVRTGSGSRYFLE
jgi:hypothetical protein